MMKDRALSKKLWRDRRSKKILIRRGKTRSSGKKKRKKNQEYFYVEAPEVFSFSENTDETIEYFRCYIDEMQKKIVNEKIFFGSKNVKIVSLDALTYIIAVVKNIKWNYICKHDISGDFPIDPIAKVVYIASGFTRFFRSKANLLPLDGEHFRIITDEKSNGQQAKKICDFVMLSLGYARNKIIPLQKTLVEMMTNARNHAYLNDKLMNPVWYCCAEYNDDRVQITFLDTGMGIAKTVRRKNIIEKVISIDDSELIYSAFLGQRESATRLVNRGNGMPSIFETVQSGFFSEFMVLSGSGECRMTGNSQGYLLTKKEHDSKIYGTIYMMQISKKGVTND